MLNSYEIINFKHHKIYKIKIDGFLKKTKKTIPNFVPLFFYETHE